MASINEKLEYLNDTKLLLKDIINYSQAEITSETTFRNYATKLYDGYINILKDRNILFDAIPKSIETGTELFINNAENLSVYELELEKESSQKTTSGKSIFKFANTTRTHSGITGSVDNNILKVSGTASSNFSILTPPNASINLPAGDYTFAINKVLPVALSLNLNTGAQRIEAGSTTISFTLTETATTFDLRMPTTSGTAYNFEVGLMIANGLNQTYEEYTGGQSSPNPDYPQEVKTVKGYKNLLDINEEYTFTGNPTLSINIPAGTYYLTNKSAVNSSDTNEVFVRFNNNNVRYNLSENKNIVLTFIDDETAMTLYSKTNASGSVGISATIKQLMISEKELPYVPYGNNYVYIKNVGKNLLPQSVLESVTSNGITFTNNEDGTYTLTGTATADARFFLFRRNERNLYVDTIQQTLSVNNISTARLTISDNDGNTGTPYKTLTSSAPTFTFTPTNAGVVSYLLLYVPNGASIDTTLSIQLERGSKATDFESYKGNVITIPLNDNEIVGKENNLDELLINKNGYCFINKKFAKIDSYNGETITTDYWSTTGGLDTGATIYYVKEIPELINLNYTVNMVLLDGINDISNFDNMNMKIKYIAKR